MPIDPRDELTDLETRMQALAPTTDAWWSLLPRRNELRDAVNEAWRCERHYGTRPDGAAFDKWPWPDDVDARWRTIRAFLEDARGIRVGDLGATSARLASIRQAHGTIGTSLAHWIVLVDQLRDAGWLHAFRDAISLRRIDGTQRFSVLVAGENDYDWTVRLADLAQADPPVAGLAVDPETGRRKVATKRAAPDSTQGTWPHLTDFVRQMLEIYRSTIGEHPRVQVESLRAQRERSRAATVSTASPSALAFHAPNGETLTLAAAIEHVRREEPLFWSGAATLTAPGGWNVRLTPDGAGFRATVTIGTTTLAAHQWGNAGDVVVTREQAEDILQCFATRRTTSTLVAWTVESAAE